MKENPKRLLCLKNCRVRKYIFFLTTLQHSLTYSLSPLCLFAEFIFDKTFYFLYRVTDVLRHTIYTPTITCKNDTMKEAKTIAQARQPPSGISPPSSPFTIVFHKFTHWVLLKEVNEIHQICRFHIFFLIHGSLCKSFLRQ